VFGFLVWELKENWRLYEANRREFLGRLVVGSHGETIGRLLRLASTRDAAKVVRQAAQGGRRRSWTGVRGVLKHQESLHHVEESIDRFIDREFLSLVQQSRTLGPLGFDLGELSVSTNRIRVDIHRNGHSSQ